MERTLKKVFVLVFCIAIGLAAGCEEQEMTSTKKCRLIAAENMELKKDLELRNKEIEGLKKRQEGQLADCRKEAKDWKEKAGKNVEEKVNTMMGIVMEQTAQLHKENETLKAQVEELKAKLKEQAESEKKN